jgi:hypothetical protein
MGPQVLQLNGGADVIRLSTQNGPLSLGSSKKRAAL